MDLSDRFGPFLTLVPFRVPLPSPCEVDPEELDDKEGEDGEDEDEEAEEDEEEDEEGEGDLDLTRFLLRSDMRLAQERRLKRRCMPYQRASKARTLPLYSYHRLKKNNGENNYPTSNG